MNTPVSLLERLRQPDQPEAWKRFVDLYTPMLFLWARRLGLQTSDAADLVQDVFAVLVEKLPEFRYDRRKSFQAWLHTILLNKWRNRHRRQLELSLEEIAPGLSDLIAPPEHDAVSEAEYRRHLVHRALELMRAEFQPCTWKACWDFVVNGRPAADVAAELGLTVNTVYLAKSRVLRRLREELTGLLE